MADNYYNHQMPDIFADIFNKGFAGSKSYSSDSNSTDSHTDSSYDDSDYCESCAELKQRLATLQKKYDDLLEEFGQYKERVKANTETEKKNAKKELIKGFLNDFVVFMVNTYKGKKNHGNKLDDTDYFILNKMNDYLTSMNVTPMEDAVGKAFDYKTMDAVYADRTTTNLPSGTVSTVIYNGFTMDGEVILPQKVAVIP